MKITNSEIVALLRAARAQIESPDHWTQRAFARDVDSFRCAAQSPSAVCWCLVGAFQLQERRFGLLRASKALSALGGASALVIYNDSHSHAKVASALVIYNDSHSHAKVLALIDATIANLETVRTREEAGA